MIEKKICEIGTELDQDLPSFCPVCPCAVAADGWPTLADATVLECAPNPDGIFLTYDTTDPAFTVFAGNFFGNLTCAINPTDGPVVFTPVTEEEDVLCQAVLFRFAADAGVSCGPD